MENGDSKRVNHAKKSDDFSFDGVTNNEGLYFKNGKIWFNRRLSLETNFDKCMEDPYFQNGFDYKKIKYCRLTSRIIRGQTRYYVQLVMDGFPPATNRTYGAGNVTILDVKISHMDMIDENGEVKTIEIAPGCKNNEEKIAEIDRKMDRSRRASNPDNYNDDGTVKKGRKKWVNSKNYEKLRNQRKEIYRVNAETRKISNEKLANDILAVGTDITVKKLSYKELQKRKKETEINEKTGRPKSKSVAGKSIAQRSPATFISSLDRKLNYIGKSLTVIK
jgi:hypothetical protein